eukprot:410218-Lingulodinium_polyedra.AAC.1
MARPQNDLRNACVARGGEPPVWPPSVRGIDHYVCPRRVATAAETVLLGARAVNVSSRRA